MVEPRRARERPGLTGPEPPAGVPVTAWLCGRRGLAAGKPFEQTFDLALRRQLGVWYTPAEVVRYMVARVDRALKDALGIADGFAAEDVTRDRAAPRARSAMGRTGGLRCCSCVPPGTTVLASRQSATFL